MIGALGAVFIGVMATIFPVSTAVAASAGLAGLAAGLIPRAPARKREEEDSSQG
jgi:hypothetical protein